MEIILIFIVSYYLIKYFAETDKKRKEGIYSADDSRLDPVEILGEIHVKEDRLGGGLQDPVYYKSYDQYYETNKQIYNEIDRTRGNKQIREKAVKDNNKTNGLDNRIQELEGHKDSKLNTLNHNNLRQGIILSEILSRPKAANHPYFK